MIKQILRERGFIISALIPHQCTKCPKKQSSKGNHKECTTVFGILQLLCVRIHSISQNHVYYTNITKNGSHQFFA